MKNKIKLKLRHFKPLFIVLISISSNLTAQVHRFVAPSVNGDFNPCVQLLSDGLRDVYTTVNNVSFFSDSKTYFESDQFLYDYHSGKWNGGISVVIDGAPLGLNAGASDNDIHQFQSKIRQSASLIINLQTYSTITRSTLNIDLANAFNECVAINQTFGLSIDLNGSDDKSVTVTVKYKPLASGDNHPKISNVQLIGLDESATQSILNSTLKQGTIIPDQIAFSAYRKLNQPFIIVINSNNGLSMIKRLESSDDNNVGLAPIGTVISSLLDFDTFSKLTKNNGSSAGTWSPTKSKWSPCDGRSVVGSKYQTTWAGALGPNLPDLRGVFLRGLNKFDPLEATAVNSQANPDEPTTKNQVQPDAVGKHTHVVDMRTGYMLVLEDWQHPVPASIFVGDRRAFGNAYGQLTAKEVPGSTETRPKNVSIYYYIKIN